MRHYFVFFLLLTSFFSITSHAFLMDVLGKIAEPLIGSAKDKASGALKYLWVQPYAGYGLGSGNLTYTSSTVANNYSGAMKYEGFFFGGRGGFILGQHFRIGVDYTRLLGEKTEPTGQATSLTQQQSKAIGVLWGALIAFDVPNTPIQAHGIRYLSANLDSGSSTGQGWGGGISFMLVSPFILLTEYRSLEFKSSVGTGGTQTKRTMNQFMMSLSFFLL